MTGQQVCFPTVILPKRCRTPGLRGDPLKYLVTHEYNCPFPWSMSLETQRPHMNSAPIAEYTIGTYVTLLDQARTSTPGVTPLKKELPFLAGQLHERTQVKELRSSLHNHSIM